MAPEAVDDMYHGCTKQMKNSIKKKDLESDLKSVLKLETNFIGAWERIETCSTRKPDTEDKALTKNHMMAICAYTSDSIYSKFNTAVRTQKKNYGSSFKFLSLHYWLTTAIQILNNNYHCTTAYRRTKLEFIGNVNDRIRFGTFASSSKDTRLTNFGTKTCFKIETCTGAHLKHYSVFGDSEHEVLIPPYEMFKITSSNKADVPELDDCKTVYTLQSAGGKSELNCKAAKVSYLSHL